MYLRSGPHPEPVNPTGGAYSTPPDTLLVGRGLAAPTPRTLPPLSALGLEFRPFRQKDMDSVSNQNRCKGFCFTEKV